MIEKMKVVHIVTTVPEKADMLTRLRALGIVHFSEKAASDPRYPERFAALSRMTTALQEYPAQPEEALLSDEEFESFFQKLSACLDRKKALQEKRTAAHASAEKLAEWGRFSPAEVEELRSRGWEVHIYRTDKKTLAALTADPDISFVRLASVGKMPTLATFAPLPDSYSATEFPLPEKGLAELELEQEYCDRGLAECEEFLTQAARHLPSIRDQMLKTQNAAEYSAVSNSSQIQDGLLWLRGYLPAAQVEEFKAAAAQAHWAWALEDPDADDDRVPTKVKYNKITKLMIPVFDILGTVPGYREYDISFWFLGFFTLFFAMIIGDAGYGCLFLLLALVLTLKGKGKSSAVQLLWVLSIATVIWGSLTGTWFGLEQAMEVPLLKKLVIPGFANYPAYFDVSTTAQQNAIMKFCFILGTVQLSLACVMNIRRKLTEKDLSWVADLGWLAAIDAFNAAGGTVILAGWSDNYENYDVIQSNPAIKHMAATQNEVLQALGSSLRIADDATYDDVRSAADGVDKWRLYFNTYGQSFLTDGVEVDPAHPYDRLYTEVFSHYGGASVYAVDADGNPTSALPATVTPVVYTHPTTYSVDVDKDGLGGANVPKYAYAENDSRLLAMASEQLEGKGLIIVSGAAFMSNFEVQATISDNGSEKNYSNYKICENLLGRINPVKITDIATVQAQTEAGHKYTIEGVVTSNASGYDKATAFFDCIYVQDETGGINCFPVAGDFKIGDVVRVTGVTETYQGENELQVSSIEKIGETTPVTPRAVTSTQINDGSVLGQLVTLNGYVTGYEMADGLVQTILVRDSEGKIARVFIDGYITTSYDVANLSVGCQISATGLASYDNTFVLADGTPMAPRIRVRDRNDVVCTAHEHTFGEWIVTTQPTCTEPGEKTRTCTGCGEVETMVIDATGHHYKDGKCTDCGEKDPNYQPAQPGVKTGDASSVTLWVMLLTVSALLAAAVVALPRRKHN